MKPEKVKTGIDTLDSILDGGIPSKHAVLLAGSCGTGKTILSQTFLFTGAKYYGDTGLYISLSESKEKMLSYLSNFEFYDQKMVDEQKIKIVDITEDLMMRNLEPLTVESVMNVILTVVKQNKAKRVVLDSVTAICNSLHKEVNIRDFLFALGLQLEHLDCTTLLISEIPPMAFQYSVFGVEEFITDGVILMREMESKGGDLLRTLQVVKMRGVAHSRNRNIVEITNRGMELKPMFEQI